MKRLQKSIISIFLAISAMAVLLTPITIFASDSNGANTSLWVKEHINYIQGDDYYDRHRLNFYTNVWDYEEQNNQFKESTYNVYKIVDYLSEIFTFDVFGFIDGITAEANFYETFICDLAVSATDSVTPEYISGKFSKQLQTVNGSTLELFEAYAKTEEFQKKLSVWSTQYDSFAEMAGVDIVSSVSDYLTIGAIGRGDIEEAIGVITKDFVNSNQSELHKLYGAGKTANKILGHINDGINIMTAIKEANCAYSAVQCVKAVHTEIEDIIYEVCDELDRIGTEAVDAQKMREAFYSLTQKFDMSEDEMVAEFLAETIAEMAYSKFIKSALTRSVQVSVVKLLYKGVSHNSAVSFVNGGNSVTLVFAAAFSITDMLSKGNERIDAYFQMRQIAEFEKAFSNVMYRKSNAILTNKTYESIDEFEVAFKYWAAVNYYLYDACYTYNEKYASQFMGITWDNEEREAVLESMSSLKYYWSDYNCHSNIKSCGSNIIWAIYDGELIIEGVGGIPDFSPNGAPWSDERIEKITMQGDITQIGEYSFYSSYPLSSIDISDNVTTIGDYAFANCSSLETVNIGDGVTTIGDSAFAGCYMLKSVDIGDSVTTIGASAFSNCIRLTKVDIPNGVTTIGTAAFANCDSLTTVNIGNGVTKIGNNAFYDCDGLWNVVIPDNVTTIGDGAFYSCDALTNVHIGDGVVKIGLRAFEDCVNLANLHIGDGVATIGKDAFANCSNLVDVYIGDRVTNLDAFSFTGSENLKSIYIGDGITAIAPRAFEECSGLTDVHIGDGVTSIGDYAFTSCDSLTSVEIGDSVTSIGYSAFAGCDSLTSVGISSIEAWCAIEFGGGHGASPLIYAHKLYLNGVLVVDLKIPDSVTTIGYQAFADCDSLTSVDIPDSVTSIGMSAFAYCDSLTSVDIPSSVTSIGGYAFTSCDSLTSVDIPDSVTSIGSYAFAYCYSLTSITVDANNTKYSSDEYGVLFNKDKTTLIQYPIGNERTEYTIPDSVTSIGNSAFFDCDGLTSIAIPDSVTTIGYQAFAYCHSLTSVDIPDSVTSIGMSAFADCDSLTSVDIPDSVTSIGYWAFRDCDSLTSVVIGNSVTSISSHAFIRCDSLTKATIYSRDAEFGSDVFDSTSSTFELHGYLGSTAQTYASESGHTFVGMVETDAPVEATVTAPANGFIEGENTFTVACDKPCRVFVSNDGGDSYDRLTATANSSGGYDFTATLTSESKIVVILVGDVDGDGTIELADYALAREIFLDSTYEADVLTKIMTDSNESGKITVSDITMIRRILLGYVPKW